MNKEQLPYGYVDDNSTKPVVTKIMVEYSQGPDTNQERDQIQTIRLETEENGAGCGPYLRMSMPYGGVWSFIDEKDIVELIKDFKDRINFVSD